MKDFRELGKTICLTGCPENGWNQKLIKEMYQALIDAAINLIKTNRNVSHPDVDICDILTKISKAEHKLIIELEETGWENDLKTK